MTTCTAPTPAQITLDPDYENGRPRTWEVDMPPAWTADRCPAPAPLICQGTDWPPMTSTQRYAEDRRLGQRVPPSVSVWRPEDVRRQQEADARIRARASERLVAVTPGEGPACEPEPCRPAHMIGVRS